MDGSKVALALLITFTTQIQMLRYQRRTLRKDKKAFSFRGPIISNSLATQGKLASSLRQCFYRTIYFKVCNLIPCYNFFPFSTLYYINKKTSRSL